MRLDVITKVNNRMSQTVKELKQCTVCVLLDNDLREKECTYCGKCMAWICDSDLTNWPRRAKAMARRKIKSLMETV